MATTPKGDDAALRAAIVRGLAAQIVKQRRRSARGSGPRPLAPVTPSNAGVPMAPRAISEALR